MVVEIKYTGNKMYTVYIETMTSLYKDLFSDLMLLLSSYPALFLSCVLSTGAAQDFGVGYHWTRGTCTQSSRGGEWQ